jgi:hypothetical protein
VLRLVGDFGFDPLNLGADPKNLAWYVQAELVHARFAMLGAAGILLPEIGTKMGLLNVPVSCTLCPRCDPPEDDGAALMSASS